MSIIVKGINILPYCEGLIFTDHNTVLWADDDMQIHEYEVIQIPKSHGRLIDEREVKKSQFIINDQWGSYPVISLGNLNCVSTILEAEE